jgi:nucleoside-diphosphate-sugar epimerase
MAGVKFGTSSAAGLLKRLNAVMPELVAEHYRGSRIVALSTGCVYSFTAPESGGSTEDAATDPPGVYAQSCLQRERAFINGSQTHGTKCALVRLNYSIDLRYGVLVDIAQQVKAGTPIDVTTGYVNVIWQGDAVAQILQCLPLADSPPLVINVTGAETLAVRELATQFADRFGCIAEFTGTEAATCWLNNSARARELFGEPRVCVRQMMDWIADWIDRGGETLGKPTQFQTRDGNY